MRILIRHFAHIVRKLPASAPSDAVRHSGGGRAAPGGFLVPVPVGAVTRPPAAAADSCTRRDSSYPEGMSCPNRSRQRAVVGSSGEIGSRSDAGMQKGFRPETGILPDSSPAVAGKSCPYGRGTRDGRTVCAPTAGLSRSCHSERSRRIRPPTSRHSERSCHCSPRGAADPVSHRDDLRRDRPAVLCMTAQTNARLGTL